MVGGIAIAAIAATAPYTIIYLGSIALGGRRYAVISCMMVGYFTDAMNDLDVNQIPPPSSCSMPVLRRRSSRTTVLLGGQLGHARWIWALARLKDALFPLLVAILAADLRHYTACKCHELLGDLMDSIAVYPAALVLRMRDTINLHLS